ncbi:MAG TPA: vWA domain-containing protein [Thermoanaerobaculia bacterium]|nr:vWA domain-containing protein [Thermoanaerobaculia bacterium]
MTGNDSKFDLETGSMTAETVLCSSLFRTVAALACLGVLLAVPAGGQSTARSSEARPAQFVLVLDDSASMKETDPDRLAVFAARSLVSMLDDRDEVSVVRLNGPRDGAPPPAIAPLRNHRPQIEQLLSLNGGIAVYSAEHTPCRSALAAVRRLLDAAHRPGVAQVVMLLTDGQCTPRGEEEPQVEDFLGGLRSQDEGLFQFYLLRFRGKDFSSPLVRLAERTGGQAIEAHPGDPTSILHTFAAALSRSQGYEAYLLSPREARLAAHRGAERVRLLAIAPGSGQNLSFILRNPRSGAPRTAGKTRAGTHQYGAHGKVFRFAALDYQPDTEPVEVEVPGGGDRWKVVALPEYRLAVRQFVRSGNCDRPGGEVASVAVGESVCAIAELVNADGQVVGGEVTGGDLIARVKVRRADRPGEPPVELAANPLAAGQARFGLPRSHLEKGDYEFQSLAILRLSSGESIVLRSTPALLEVSSIEIHPQPARFDFGRLRPGELAQSPWRLAGNFPKASGHLELGERADLPACVTAELNGAPEGKPQPILPGQGYNLVLRVSPYCGPQPIGRKVNTVLRLVFAADGGRQLPAIELPLTFELEYHIDVPKELTVKVRGGEARDLPVPVGGSFQKKVSLRAVVAGPKEAEAWPEDGEDLVLGFAGEDHKEVLRGDRGGPLLGHDFSAGPGSSPLRLRVLPGRCCAAGSFETRLGLAPASRQPLPPGAEPPEPIVVPVRIEVEPAGFWACHGPLLLAAFATLLLLVLILYGINMFCNSTFLNPETLAAKLKPLVWTEYGDAVELDRSKGEVARLVRQALPLPRRAAVWLRSNPLRFGLPGGRYRETAQILLQANRDVARSQIVLLAEGDVQAQAEREPQGLRGRLFAIAAGKVLFLAVPDAQGRLGSLVWENGLGAPPPDGEPARLRAVKLHKAKLLRPLEDWETPEEGKAAGWQIG